VKDWNDLRHFLAIWRARTLAGAARELRVDQTTVGRRLTALEDALGGPLFERTPDGLVPTALAAQLVASAQAIEQATIDLERIAAGGGERLEGAVRLATTEAFAICFVLPELRALRAEHPRIALHLVTSARTSNLLRSEADLALRVGPRPEQQSLVVRKIGTVHWSIYGSAAYLEAHPWQGSLDEHDVVAFDESLTHIPPALWLEGASARTHVTVRMTSPLTGAAAVRSGWGLAVLPDFVARADPSLIRLSSDSVASDEVWIAVHPDLQHTPRIRAVIEHLVAAAHRAGVVAAAPTDGRER
jgi:DNA-binding transcriptional LysR family regulator